VLTVVGDQIAAVDRFVDNSLLPRFGLPRTLPEELAALSYQSLNSASETGPGSEYTNS
jgi:hypothetical protein